MTTLLQLRTDAEHRITASLNAEFVMAATARAALPALAELQADPLEAGKRLTQALGGAALLDRLEADPDRLLLIDADDDARPIPWEYAALPDRQLLAVQYAVLRLVDRPAAPAATGPLNFVVLAADPLVDAQGQPREGYRLQVEGELREVRRVLRASGVALHAQRLPPVKAALKRALLRGPAILHLTCHGTVITTPTGPMATLLLEDADGKEDRLLGSDLVAMPPRGVLQGVLLSACHTAQGTQADLAHALVRNGVPWALGMQGAFPDRLGDALAVTFYETLLAGQSVAEAARQARHTLLMASPEAAGLPVIYAVRDGWRSLPVQAGQAVVGGLGLPGQVQLTSEVQPPRPLLGRNRELHDVARLYSAGQRVVTVNGTGGVGKTALAAAFAERFAWRWSQGVRTLSFASEVVNAAALRGALLRALRGEAEAQALAAADAETQLTAILAAARDWDGLLLVDNYESVLQGLEEKNTEAGAVHRLLAQLAEGGLHLLLTSRQQPAQLRGEVLYPGHDDPLAGLKLAAADDLFLEHSARAKDAARSKDAARAADRAAHVQLAADIARATEGHPLAIALLAGEYDDSPVSPAAFLSGWQAELADAERAGLAGHHRTFGAAFARSYDRLTPDRQTRLCALSVFGFPFFAQGAALVWGQTLDDLTPVKEGLLYFTHRNLLEVDGRFEDQTPATYRFQPALRQEIARRAAEPRGENAAQQAGYAAYADWFVQLAFSQSGKEVPIARLFVNTADELVAQTAAQPAEKQAAYCWRLGYLLRQIGRIPDAERLAALGLTGADTVMRSRLLSEQANLATLSGDLDRALQLYQESLLLKEQLGDKQGKAASLSNMAQVFLTRGDLDRALQLYQESLLLKEQLGDKKGKAASLGQMANIFMARQEWVVAEGYLQQALRLAHELQAADLVAFDTVKMGQVAQGRGDLATALTRYREGLEIFERIGMPREISQVRQLIAQLEGGAAPAHDPLAQAIGRARQAAQQGKVEEAIAAQEEAVALARQTGDSREALVNLSVLLYNLGGYYLNADRPEEAVHALEEVVALDERTGHPDLESDRRMLEQARHMAALSPEERARLQSTAADDEDQAEPGEDGELDLSALPPEVLAQLQGLSPAERAQIEAQLRQAIKQFQAMSPAERAQLAAAQQAGAQRQQIETLARQARDGALAALRGQTDRAALAGRIQQVIDQISANEAVTSPWGELVAYLEAVVALLNHEAVPPVPAAYAAHFAAIQAG